MRQNIATPPSVRKHPETFCWTDDSSEGLAPPGCCQKGPRNRAGTGVRPTSSERADPTDYEQDFVWVALLVASGKAVEEDWLGS